MKNFLKLFLMQRTFKFISILSFCLILCCVKTEQGKRLFVFDDATGIIKEYSVDDFRARRELQIPKDLYFLKTTSPIISKGPTISASGRIVYYDDNTNSDSGTVVRKLWYWDGKKEHRSEITKKLRCLPTKNLCFASDEFSSPILDAVEPKIYWAVNRVASFRQEPPDYEYGMHYIKTDFEIYSIHFNDDKLFEELIAKIPLNECACSTGDCSETCSIGHIVASEEGIKDFIEVEHFIGGQLESRVEGHTYFEKKNKQWLKTSVNKKLEKPFIQWISDSGCCGWVNESSDVLLIKDGKNEKKMYDEWERFNNRNYDISFYPVNYELTPDFKRIAYHIEPDQWAMSYFKEEGTFRLSSDGKEDLKLKNMKARKCSKAATKESIVS